MLHFETAIDDASDNTGGASTSNLLELGKGLSKILSDAATHPLLDPRSGVFCGHPVIARFGVTSI